MSVWSIQIILFLNRNNSLDARDLLKSCLFGICIVPSDASLPASLKVFTKSICGLRETTSYFQDSRNVSQSIKKDNHTHSLPTHTQVEFVLL